jgi:hypothetical protein
MSAYRRHIRDMTPLFLYSRLLARVPIQSFERWVGGRALGGSRNLEVWPNPEHLRHEYDAERVHSPGGLGGYVSELSSTVPIRSRNRVLSAEAH